MYFEKTTRYHPTQTVKFARLNTGVLVIAAVKYVPFVVIPLGLHRIAKSLKEYSKKYYGFWLKMMTGWVLYKHSLKEKKQKTSSYSSMLIPYVFSKILKMLK